MDSLIHTIVSWAIKHTPEWYRDSSDSERLDILNCLSGEYGTSRELLYRIPSLIRGLNEEQWKSLESFLHELSNDNGVS